MNPVLRWLTTPEWAHTVTALLHSLWQGALVALVLAVLLRRQANPLTRYRCALSALAIIVIAGLITWGILNAPTTAPNPISPVANDSVATPVTVGAFAPSPANRVVFVAPLTQPTAPTNWTTWLALLWMTGAMVMLLRAGIKVAGAEKLRRSCQPLADENIAALVAEACRAVGLARKIRVAVTDKLTSPAVVGVIVPTLILPLSLFTTLTPPQIQFVLLHELAHIRRGDYLANLFQLFAEALLFFNPAVWWISHQIRREREACCDALAIELSGAPADYARTLVRVAENILQPAPAAAPAFGDDGREPSSLADRVQRLLVPGYRPALRLTWRAISLSLVLGLGLLILSAGATKLAMAQIVKPSGEVRTTTNTTSRPLEISAGHITVNLDSGEVVASNRVQAVINGQPTNSEVLQHSLPTPNLGSNAPTSDKFYVRAFEVSPKFLHERIVPKLSELELSQLPTNTNNVRIAAEGIRAWVQQMGVDLDPAMGKGIFYNDPHGTMLVRATMSELDVIETTLRETMPEAPLLSTRIFQVVPETIAKAIEVAMPEFKSVIATNVTAGLRALFLTAGVDLSPPKVIFYNDRAGGLFVRATPEDLDAIESLLHVIGQQPPQVNIKAVFVEIPFGKAQPKELAKILEPIAPESGITFTGILTASQFKAVLRALEKSSSAKFLAMPQVTTLSGRQAQIQVKDMKTIVSGMTAVVTNGMTNLVYQSEAMSFGPVLELLPTVSNDGYTVQMTLTPTFTEFLGYEDPKKLKPSLPAGLATLPLPIIRTRQMTTSANVWDGQTIVLGNFSDQMLDTPPDLKGAPKASGKKQSKQLLVFVTPTIIDPAGNPANKDMGIPSILIR